MVHVNIPKVRGKMAEKGYSITSLANMLKISRETLDSYFSTPENAVQRRGEPCGYSLRHNGRSDHHLFFTPKLTFYASFGGKGRLRNRKGGFAHE